MTLFRPPRMRDGVPPGDAVTSATTRLPGTSARSNNESFASAILAGAAATAWTTMLCPAASPPATRPPKPSFVYRRSAHPGIQRELQAYAGIRDVVPVARQQGESMVRLHHRHLTAVVRGVDGLTAVELCNDGTLSEWLATANPTAAERLEALQQIAAAVEYLHAEGYAHGDVRPANIMRHRITAGACAYAGHGCTGQLEPVVGAASRGRQCSVCQGAQRTVAVECSGCHYGVCSQCRSYSGTFVRVVLGSSLISLGSRRATQDAPSTASSSLVRSYVSVERLARRRGLNPPTAATVPYQAPEVLEALCSEGQPTLNLALNDVWALGCVAYEVMTGKSWWSDVQRMSRRTDDHDSMDVHELSAPLLTRVGHPDVEAALRVAMIDVKQRADATSFRWRLLPVSATWWLIGLGGVAAIIVAVVFLMPVLIDVLLRSPRWAVAAVDPVFTRY